MDYLVNEFLGLKCAGDVLNAVAPLNNPSKEISESMAMVKAMKGMALKSPMAFTLWDLCAGNALTGILAVHLLPFDKVISVDKKPRKRAGHSKVERWEYVQGNVESDDLWRDIQKSAPAVISSTHPCGMAIEIARRASVDRAFGIFIMPCCLGPMPGCDPLIEAKLSKYERWCLYVAEACDGKCVRNTGVLSPANVIVKYERELL